MEKNCEEIFELLVDFTDGQLLPDESAEVTEHLAKCPQCRENLKALEKSLKLANIIWEDALTDIEPVHIAHPQKVRKIQWAKYAAVAASILLVFGISALLRSLNKPAEPLPTFAEIERKINDEAAATKLLAAAYLLANQPNVKEIAKQQYNHIIEIYPQTNAAVKAKLLIKNN
jgi:predicted anti-sigma-YlaC factor YlaD